MGIFNYKWEATSHHLVLRPSSVHHAVCKAGLGGMSPYSDGEMMKASEGASRRRTEGTR